MTKIVLASSNQGKLDEFQLLLAIDGLSWVAQSEYGVEDADETGSTFKENALIKAHHAVLHTGMPALADDSGLEVEVLNGAPGIYSARYAGVHGDNQANIDKLIAALKAKQVKRSPARYVCALALVDSNGQEIAVVEEYLHGEVITEQQGQSGFGYDPIFYLPTEGKTVASLAYHYKQSISHRARALAKLKTSVEAWLS